MRSSGARLCSWAAAIVAIAFWAAVLPATAGAWSVPARLSVLGPVSTTFVGYQQAGVDGRGDQTALWTEQDGFEPQAVGVSSRLASGGGWSAPAMLTTSPMRAQGAQLAVAPSGRAVAVWQQNSQLGSAILVIPSQVMVSVRESASGSWSTPVALSTADQVAAAPSVAVSARGAFVVGWSYVLTSNANSGGIATATLAAGSSSWSAPITVTTGRTVGTVSVAVDSRGNATAAWGEGGGGTAIHPIPAHVLASTLAAGAGRWGKPIRVGRMFAVFGQLAGNDLQLRPAIAVTPAGSVVLAWQAPGRVVGNSRGIRLGSAMRIGPAGRWRDAVPTGSPTGVVAWPQIAVTAHGTVIAVADSSAAAVAAFTRPITDRHWSAPVALATSPRIEGLPAIAANPRGQAIAVWDGFGLTAATYSQQTGAWSRPQVVANSTNDGSRPAIALNLSGAALTVFPQLTRRRPLTGQTIAAATRATNCSCRRAPH